MSDNLIDELISDNKCQTSCSNSDYLSSQFGCSENDSDLFLNLIDSEILNQPPSDNYSPFFNMSDFPSNNTCNDQLASPDVNSRGLNQNFEDVLLSKLPQVFAVERTSIQYQIVDQMNPGLSKSFQNCFHSPVLDLLVVVLDSNKLVTFYQGYFAGIPKLKNELINLTGKYWKSLISNNDDSAWENHFKSVTAKYNSKRNYEPEFEAGPVIRCRLRSCSGSQLNQQFNYFFVQPGSFYINVPVSHLKTKSVDYNPINNSNGDIISYFVSYINIVRECDTEYALKGSAAASLQKVITNATLSNRQQKNDTTLNISSPSSNSKQSNSGRNFRLNIPNSSSSSSVHNQLSVNISSPIYSNVDRSTIPTSAPLTYPLISNQKPEHYNTKNNPFTNAQIQHQRQSSIPVNHNSQYMSPGNCLSTSTVDPHQNRYSSGHYINSHSPSLQRILENRNTSEYTDVKQIQSTNHHHHHQHHHHHHHHHPTQHPSQHPQQHHLQRHYGQIYKNPVQSNNAYYLQSAQSAQSNCSLSSLTSFMPVRQVIQMSNSILMSSSDNQYFRNNHQMGLMDSGQVTQQPMMTVVQSIQSAGSTRSPSNYYYSTAQNQILHNPLHINTSLTNQSQFVSSSISPYCNTDRGSTEHQDYSSSAISSRNKSPNPVDQETYDINLCQNNWLSNSVLDSGDSPLFTNNTISMDIVEEILQAEEAKSENKSLDHDLSKSDSSESLMSYLNDFMSTSNITSTPVFSTANVSISKSASSQLMDFNSLRADTKVPECKSNPQTINSVINLKSELLKNLNNTQRLHIKKIVNQYKSEKIEKITMYQQINHFLNQTLGSRTYNEQVIKFWNTTHQQYSLADNVDSSLSGFNYSHIVQSPEEGPGISPTEQAAQSTTDLEEDKDDKYIAKVCVSKLKENNIVNDKNRKHKQLRSTPKSSEASIYSITSTTSTGVLETLLNEHDNPKNCDKKSNSSGVTSNVGPRFSISKNQLSLDQLLLMDDCFPYSSGMENILLKKPSSRLTNSYPGSGKSQPSTIIVNNNKGVLETLLNQKTSSMFTLRQISTDNILKHSKPSRQSSLEIFTDDSMNSYEILDKEKEKGLKKNSLLITLLNTSQNSEKGKMIHSTTSTDSASPNIKNKRRRMVSSESQPSFDINFLNKKSSDDKLITNDIDVFDFVDNELNYCTNDTQSTIVTSTKPVSVRNKPRVAANKQRSRKRHYSKESSIDSEGSSDRLSSVGEKWMRNGTAAVKTEERNVILTSLLENKIPQDSSLIPPSDKILLSGLGKSEIDSAIQITGTYDSAIITDDNLDLEDIKIDDLDLGDFIDITENYDDSTSEFVDVHYDQPQISTLQQSNNNCDSSLPSSIMLSNKSITDNSFINASQTEAMPPVYKKVGPIIKSDPIIPMSRQSIIRVSDKNSILLSAIQSTSTSHSNSFECLDSERERLLYQQQHQKVCMGDKPSGAVNHQLSLDMLSKQMKEVGPNVMVELSVKSDVPVSRKSSICRQSQCAVPVSTSSYLSDNNKIHMSSSNRSTSHQSNCPLEMTSENNMKIGSSSIGLLNHQQVREGLRLLVSNRSAQNNSRNNAQSQRTNLVNLAATQTHNESNSSPSPILKSSVKDVLHYPSNVQSSIGSQKESPYSSYMSQSYTASNLPQNTSKTSDILEDSLVNDVFGLEELINNKSRQLNPQSFDYSMLNFQETTKEEKTESKYSPGTFQPNMNRVSYGHSQLPSQQYSSETQNNHHYDLENNFHPQQTTFSPMSLNNLNNSVSKEKQNTNSGLLETLLS